MLDYTTKASLEAMTATTHYVVDVKALAKSTTPKWEKAKVADDISSGRAIPINFSQKQAAALVEVSASYVSILSCHGKHGRKLTLAESLMQATPGEKLTAAKAVGVDTVWEQMVLPLLPA
jgi:hypothetical protein